MTTDSEPKGLTIYPLILEPQIFKFYSSLKSLGRLLSGFPTKLYRLKPFPSGVEGKAFWQ